jgi:hypothetical protein
VLISFFSSYPQSSAINSTTSLSTTSVAASGGTITVNYTVKENWTNGKTPTPKAGVTPTITSSIGTVSNITATDANGNGTAKITVASRGTTVGAAQTGTVSVSFGGVAKTATFTQALNKITSVRIAGSIPSGGAYTNPPSYNNQAPASGTTWSPFTIYPTFSSGATTGNYGGDAITQSNWSISGEGFSVASANGWWAVKVTAANRGTTIGDARTGTLTVTIPDGVGGTVSGSTSLGQAANAKTSIIYRPPVISSFSYANKNAATGTVSPSISYYQTRVQQYTSGSEETLSNINNTGGTISYSETPPSSDASVNATTGVVTWNANTGLSNRSVDITATVTMNGKSGSKATTSTQLGDEVDDIIYGNVTKGTITNATIPASGTTTNYTATAGNGSQVITKSWVSGDITTETNTVPPSVASISAKASSKGTTISNRTEVKTQAVSWKGLGNKSTSDTMHIYQAPNYITEITPKAGNANANHFYYATKGAAAGGSVSPTSNESVTYKFSSGSTGTYSASNVPSGVTWTFSRTYSGSATGATLNTSTGAVTWANNKSTSERLINVTSKLTVTCKHSSTYFDGGTLTKELPHTSTCSQNAGAKVYGTPVITKFSYPSTNISRGGGTATPTLSYSLPWTWNGVANSGETITSGANVSFSLDNTNGFSINSSGVVTAASNQHTISGVLGALPKLARETEVEVEVEFEESGDILYEYAVVKQDGDLIKSVTIDSSRFTKGSLTAPSQFTKSGGTATVSNSVASSISSIGLTYTFDSGFTSTVAATRPNNTSITNLFNINGPVYSWSSNQSYATVANTTAASASVTMSANSGAARSATITRNATWTVTPKDEYKSSAFSSAPSTSTSTTTTVSQAGAVEKQERAVYYRSPATSLPILGIQGGFAFQTGFNTSFSSSTYTLPTNVVSEDQYTGITLTEADSTKASSFYIYMNNIMVAVNSSMQPSVRMHLRVGVKSSATTFTETWYNQYITPTSIVNQNGMWIATWDSSKYALINIPATGTGGSLCHIDVEFTY